MYSSSSRVPISIVQMYDRLSLLSNEERHLNTIEEDCRLLLSISSWSMRDGEMNASILETNVIHMSSLVMKLMVEHVVLEEYIRLISTSYGNQGLVSFGCVVNEKLMIIVDRGKGWKDISGIKKVSLQGSFDLPTFRFLLPRKVAY